MVKVPVIPEKQPTTVSWIRRALRWIPYVRELEERLEHYIDAVAMYVENQEKLLDRVGEEQARVRKLYDEVKELQLEIDIYKQRIDAHQQHDE